MKDELKIAVIGTGSAGILSICGLLTAYPLNSFKIYSISDPSIPSVGIGESTGPVFWHTMWHATSISMNELLASGGLDSTLKKGTLYKNWRKEDYLHPLFGNEPDAHAIHFNTYKLKDYIFNNLKPEYKNRLKIIEGKVNQVEDDNKSVKVVIDDQAYSFDYVVDCTGFPDKNDDNYQFFDMMLNRCLVHNVDTFLNYDSHPYTVHQATNNGWMFVIPLRNRMSYGYLFNDKITSLEEARKDFSAVIGIQDNQLDNREFKFQPYFIKKAINNRVLKNGNAAVFMEPMFANSLWLYSEILNYFIDYINYNEQEETSDSTFNYLINQQMNKVHDLICLYYKGGSLFDSAFWTYAKNYSSNSLDKSLFLHSLDNKFKYMKLLKEKHYIFDALFSTDTFLEMDEYMEYNRWKI